jgi:hypothetical protein
MNESNGEVLVGFKKCSRCGAVKPHSEFYKHRTGKDGLNPHCKKCFSEEGKIYRDGHKEQQSEKSRKYYLTHKDEIDASRKAYKDANPEKISAQNKKYRETHKEERSEYQKEYYRDNKEYKLANSKAHADKHRHRTWAIAAICSHRRSGYKVNITSSELEEIAIHTTHCPICGIEIDWGRKKRGGFKPNSPSLDRKYNGTRLSLANTWLICCRCNSMKRDMPLPELVEWCRTIVDKFGSEQ